MTAKITRPCRFLPIIRPKRKGKAKGMRICEMTSTMLLSGVGFSKGKEELGPKKPPPFVPRCLIATWLAAGPRGMRSLLALERKRGHVAGETLDDALAREDEGDDDRERKEDVEDAPRHVDPEIADGCGARSRHSFRRAAMPRMTATATDMPAAAERKFCTARPTAWEK